MTVESDVIKYGREEAYLAYSELIQHHQIDIKEIRPNLLTSIEENVSEYIKNEGVPKYHYSKLNARLIEKEIFFEKYHYYPDGAEYISRLLKCLSIDEVIINFYENIPRLIAEAKELRDKPANIFSRCKNIVMVKTYMKKIYPMRKNWKNQALASLAYNLSAQESGKELNAKMQPSIRNALGIISYFKICEFEERRGYPFNIDERCREILKEVPKDIRTKQFDEKDILSDLLGPITERLLHEKNIREFQNNV